MRNFGWVASTLVALFCWGCSAYDNPLLSSGPYPRVEDCAVIQQATPTKYICGGKNYTSVQLADIRAGTTPDSRSAKTPVVGPTNLQTIPSAGAKRNP